ncbi:MAG: tetratricopeptide repeat protein [Acidobacteria bacterium]|nr:MAG: tetratricopeptide repeat protein [Acidobacteriota bacterium]
MPEDATGRLVNHRYRVEAKLGQGAAGEVYRVLDTLKGDAPLALKLLAAPATDQQAVESLRTEFFALSRLRHPNLVSVHDLGRDGDTGRWFLTMEFVDGPTLASWQAPDDNHLLNLTVRLLQAMDFIHARGFVHADIKPENILLPGGGSEPKIADFGLAGLLGLPASRRGTLPYTAPEVLRGDAPGSAADFYSLGATLYQVAFGDPPFPGETPDKIIEGHLRHDPEFPAERVDSLPHGFAIVLRRLLAKDPGARPQSGREVIEALQDLTGHQFTPGDSATRGSVLRHGSFIGRTREMETLDAALKKLSSEGSGGTVILRGPTGAGRSRILEEVRIGAQLAGVTVVRADCHPGEEDPYQHVATLLQELSALAGKPPPEELASLLSQEPSDAITGSHDPALLHEAAARLTRDAAAAAPILLLFDDLHLAHPDMLALITHMVRGCETERVLSLMSSRNDGLATSSTALDEIAAMPGAMDLDLPPLSPAESQELVSSLLGGKQPPEEVLQELVSGNQGNPYLLVETTRAFLDAGALSLDPAGEWRLDHALLGESHLSDSPAQAAAMRVGKLVPASRDILQTLSIALRPLTLSDLQSLTQASQTGAGPAVEELVERDILCRVETAGETRYRFAHVLVRDAVYRELEQTNPDAYRRLHRARADQLAAAGTRSAGDLAELARHHEMLGEKREAADLRLRAARKDRDRGAPAGAARHFRRALDLFGETPGSESVQAAVWEELGDVDRAASRPQEAGSAYSKALDATSESDAVPRSRLLWKQATIATLAGNMKEARHLLTQARVLARKSDDKSILARCFNALGNSYAREGEHARAERYYRRALNVRRKLNNEADIANSLTNLGMVATFQGRESEGQELLRQALEISRRSGDIPGIAMVANNLGIVATKGGDLLEALERFAEACKAYEEIGALGREAECLLNMAKVQIRRGRYHRAVEMAGKGLELRRRLGLLGETTEALDLMGTAYRNSGRSEAALEAHERGLATARRHQDTRQEAFALLALAGDHLAVGNAPAAENLLEQIDAGLGHEGRLGQGMDLIRVERLLVSGDGAGARAQAAEILANEEQTWDAPNFLEMRLLHIRAGVTTARFQDCLTELDEILEDKMLDFYPARAWEVQRLRASALAGLSRMDESDKAHRAALDAFAHLAGELPAEYRTALEGSQAATRLRLDGQGSSTARVAPARFLDTMYQVIEALTSVNDPDVMLDRILGLAIKLLGAERGLILMFPEGGGQPRVAVARNVEEQTIADAITYSCQVVEEGRAGHALVSPDARRDPRLRDYASVSLFQIRSVICVPLKARDRIMGTVYLDSRSRAIGFDDDDLNFLKAFAQHAATALDNAGMLRALQRENLTLRQKVLDRYSFANIVGRAPAMQEVFSTLKTVSASALPVLVLGESGTGKELVARALHYNSLRRQAAFLSENCAALPDALLESQLFGHIRGAFTGANSDQTGLFQEAHRGSLFLDEIGEMSPSLQARLTRVLETGEFRPVGAAQPVQVDVRIIAATHRNLEEMVSAGSFRRDLLFRLNVITIELPPLRERREDIPLLIGHFLEELSLELGMPAPGMSDGALELLSAREWPGNVRQLRNEISRLLVFHRGEVIGADAVREMSPAVVPSLDDYTDTPGEALPLKEMEKRHIRRALEETKGDRAQAARLLRVGRATIFRKIRDYGLDV